MINKRKVRGEIFKLTSESITLCGHQLRWAQESSRENRKASFSYVGKRYLQEWGTNGGMEQHTHTHTHTHTQVKCVYGGVVGERERE